MFALLAAVAGLLPAEPPPDFVATRASSAEPLAGSLTSIGAGFAVSFSGTETAVPAGDLLSLARRDKPRPPFPTKPHVVLANGDRIAATISGGSGLSLALKAEFGPAQSVAVPLTGVAAVWVVPPPTDTPADVSRYSWIEPAKKLDTLLLRNGDTIRGRFETVSADGGGLRFRPEGEKSAKPYELASVAALAMDPTLARVKPPSGPFARVTTADGSRVSFATLLSDGIVLTGTTVTGAKVSLPLAEVVAMDIRRGKAVELADLKPTGVKEDGFNGLAWPWAANRTVRGHPLRVATPRGEEVFDAGVGVHSKSALTFPLSGKFTRFEAIVGLDTATGRKGAVDVRVLVDGKEAKLDGLTGLTAAAGSRSIRVDVTRAKELTLIVDYGPGGDVHDDVNWADAKLVE